MGRRVPRSEWLATWSPCTCRGLLPPLIYSHTFTSTCRIRPLPPVSKKTYSEAFTYLFAAWMHAGMREGREEGGVSCIMLC